VIETYPKGIAGFRRYAALLDTEPDIADRPGAVDAPTLQGDISYRNATFGYSGERPVLKNINLDIAAGQTIAFVGPSGAGKTTVCSLLPRFYEVDSGAITVDGLDIRDMTLASLRGQIGIVQQDVFLFGGTIRENIAYGRLDAVESDIVEAARRARLHDLIASLPECLDTIIGERGVKLSGAQKQRLAIARMFLKNPTILILDEATSALDTQTEREIQQSLAELAQGRTTLVIAHRWRRSAMPIASWWSPIRASSNKVRMMNWWRLAVLTHDWARLRTDDAALKAEAEGSSTETHPIGLRNPTS
jgi:ATP-binding cassette subfamily B protein